MLGVTAFAKDAGVFYSTLYAYDPAYRMTRIEDFGKEAQQRLFGDLNGDGRDDAVAVFDSSDTGMQIKVAVSDGSNFVNPGTWLSWADAQAEDKIMLSDVTGDGKDDWVAFRKTEGSWYVAVSDGTGFAAPVLWNTGNGVGSDFQFLGDVDGDGKSDAIISWRNFNNGDWRAGLSSGSGFGGFSILKQGFGTGSEQTHFVGDLNNDKKVDFISYQKPTGNWDICTNDGTVTLGIEQNFGTNADFAGVCDMDQNGSSDLVVVGADNINWVRYLNNNLSLQEPRHRAIASCRSDWRKFHADSMTALATMDGSGKGQVFCVYNGVWQAFPANPNRDTTVVGEAVNTWETLANRFLPWKPTSNSRDDYGYYDSGDPDVCDAQIRKMHDFGFNYITLDITNGSVYWVDQRAQSFISRIRYWNQNLKPGQHPMKFCIALGNTRSVAIPGATAFFTKLEEESSRAWNEFYAANLDIVYQIDGKPLLINMLGPSANGIWETIGTWNGPRLNIDRMTQRVMLGGYAGSDFGRATYGWVEPNNNANTDPNLMVVQPGFGNGNVSFPHNQGSRYKNHWLRVLKANPFSVFTISWNEGWENAQIEPNYMNRTAAEAEWVGGEIAGKGYPGLTPWTDELGQRMDDYYYVMTRQYMKIYLSGDIYVGTVLKAENSQDVYRATPSGFVYQGSMPPQAPLLIVPDGFIENFSGNIVEDVTTVIPRVPTALGRWTFDNTGSGSQAVRLASALASSDVASGLSLSPLSANASHDFAGFNDLPNSANDGYGFGGNAGQQVLFLRRANYDNNSPSPTPRPEGRTTTWGPANGTGISTSLAGAPMSFTVSTNPFTTLTVNRLLVEGTGQGSDYFARFQSAGAAAGQSTPTGLSSMMIWANSPVVIGPSETRTFTVNLDSAALNSAHIINTVFLFGTTAPFDPYADWSTNTHQLSGLDASFSTDVDGDGIANGLEFIFGGNPKLSDTEKLPSIAVETDALVFTFRRVTSASYLDPYAEYGSTLQGWTRARHGTDGIVISERANAAAAGMDLVDIRIPLSLASGSRMFVRLAVTSTPP
ncbi:MAG: hypothetical protein ACRCXD_13160 [Luteolibacter sp.]